MTFLFSHVNFLLTVIEVTPHSQFKYVHREMQPMLTTGYFYYIFCIFITTLKPYMGRQSLVRTVSSKLSATSSCGTPQYVAKVERLWKSSPRGMVKSGPVTHPYKLQKASDHSLGTKRTTTTTPPDNSRHFLGFGHLPEVGQNSR